MNKAALIIHHTGFSSYLPFCLYQNLRSNPGREVILLGDEKNRISSLPYRHELCSRYQDSNKQLIKLYKHASGTEYFDERRCLERWFILSEFLQKTRMQSFYYMDSDYLLFCNLSEWEEQWRTGDVWGTPSFWGFSYFPNSKAVRQFCDWVLQLYVQPEHFRTLCAIYKARGTGVGDMCLISEFCREEELRVQDMNKAGFAEKAFFDDGFYGSAFHSHPYRMQEIRQPQQGGTVLTFKNNRYDKKILGLHFVGHKKSQMPGFTGWSPAVIRAFFRPNYRKNLKHLCQYLWHGLRCRTQLARPEPVSAKA